MPPSHSPHSHLFFVSAFVMGKTATVMAATIATLSLLLAISYFKGVDGTGIGVNYGRIANNLPPPPQVAHFLTQSTTIDRVKLFDADPSILQAFSGTDIAIDVTVPNDLIPNLTNIAFAQHWIRANILPHTPTTNITRILVGNEVLMTTNKSLITGLVPAMQNLHTSLVSASLDHRIKVSSPHSLGILSTSSPPSTGQFRHGYDIAVIKPLLSFLRATKSAFMVNAYPFFGFTSATLNYALFRPNPGVLDKNTRLMYTNMLDGQLDAIFSAMKLLGFMDVEIVIAETGWPSVGDASEIGVDVDSARDYNRNLVQHVSSGVGTPLMPNRTFETYIFSLFNENLKPGPTSERNFGLFKPDLTPVYDVGILKTEVRGPENSKVPPPMDLTPSGVKRWCIPKSSADPESLQLNIDYACNQGIDCGPIQSGGPCFLPNSVRAHAAYAMNEYYQSTGRNSFDCYFGQTGAITSIDPSYGSCHYNS